MSLTPYLHQWTHHSVMCPVKKINKETLALNDLLDQMNLTYIKSQQSYDGKHTKDLFQTQWYRVEMDYMAKKAKNTNTHGG